MAGDVVTSDPFRIGLGALQEGVVVSRPNRFVAVVRVRDEAGAAEREVICHVADSGRLKELIFPGNRVMVRKAKPAAQTPVPRKTQYDLVLAAYGSLCPGESGGPESHGRHEGVTGPDSDVRQARANGPTWVSVDTRYPTRLFGQVLRARLVPEFAEYDAVYPEYPFHHLEPATEPAGEPAEEPKAVPAAARKAPKSRLDFYLEGPGAPPALVEVKSVTLCVDGTGLFPDAPTDRGVRHLQELQKAVSMGYRAYAVFIAQRDDIAEVSPNRETDPKFAEMLKSAMQSGVTLLAYRCRVSPEEITFDPRAIPVTV